LRTKAQQGTGKRGSWWAGPVGQLEDAREAAGLTREQWFELDWLQRSWYMARYRAKATMRQWDEALAAEEAEREHKRSAGRWRGRR